MENVLRLLLDIKQLVPDKNNIKTLADVENLTEKKYNNIDVALQYLKYRLKQIHEISPNEFILSNEFREHYAATSVLPIKKIAE